VWTATNGVEAVERFRAAPDSVDLVILDVMMPQMGGRDALRQMQSIRPELKALFSSGYSENAVHTHYVLEKGLTLIQKPFAPADLLRTVRRVLDGASGSPES
jgi:CheY-like chemotaxis protein